MSTLLSLLVVLSTGLSPAESERFLREALGERAEITPCTFTQQGQSCTLTCGDVWITCNNSALGGGPAHNCQRSDGSWTGGAGCICPMGCGD